MSKHPFLLEDLSALEGEESVGGGASGGDDVGAEDDHATPETADLEGTHPRLELVHALDERQRPWSLEAHERLYRALMSATPPRRSLARAYTMRSRRKRLVEN